MRGGGRIGLLTIIGFFLRIELLVLLGIETRKTAHSPKANGSLEILQSAKGVGICIYKKLYPIKGRKKSSKVIHNSKYEGSAPCPVRLKTNRLCSWAEVEDIKRQKAKWQRNPTQVQETPVITITQRKKEKEMSKMKNIIN